MTAIIPLLSHFMFLLNWNKAGSNVGKKQTCVSKDNKLIQSWKNLQAKDKKSEIISSRLVKYHNYFTTKSSDRHFLTSRGQSIVLLACWPQTALIWPEWVSRELQSSHPQGNILVSHVYQPWGSPSAAPLMTQGHLVAKKRLKRFWAFWLHVTCGWEGFLISHWLKPVRK